MSWASDPRVQQLIDDKILHTIMKGFFQRVYPENDIQQMESTLENVVKKFPIYEQIKKVGLCLYEKVWYNTFENNTFEILYNILISWRFILIVFH